MTDEFDTFDSHLSRRLRSYTEPTLIDSRAAALNAMRRTPRRWRLLRLYAAALSVLGVIAVGVMLGLSYRALLPGEAGTGAPPPASNPVSSDVTGGAALTLGGAAAAFSCAADEWPPTPISCEAAESAVSMGARIDQTRIWLTNLATMQAGFPDAQARMLLPAVDTPVWVFVRDGEWSCCVHADETGELQDPEIISRWLIVVDATSGDAIFIEPWSDRPVPPALPTFAG